jgi:hypothetical protein
MQWSFSFLKEGRRNIKIGKINCIKIHHHAPLPLSREGRILEREKVMNTWEFSVLLPVPGQKHPVGLAGSLMI